MNILVLLKLDEKDVFILQLVEQLMQKGQNTFSFLNIVQAPSEVPMKSNGEVIDQCTDYDLGFQFELVGKNQSLVKTIADKVPGSKAAVKFGGPMKIIKTTIEEEHIDLVLSGAHVTTFWEDLFNKSFVELLMEHINVPLLNLKCDRPSLNWEEVVLIRDFKNPKEENLNLIHQLEELGTKIHLYKINTSNDFQTHSDILANMEKFAKINGIVNYDCSIYGAKDKRHGIEELTLKFSNHLFALGKVERRGPLSFLNGDIKSDVVNHVMAPLFIY